ncbi:aldose epimerase [Rhodanobacter sp. DHB23]|uniref:aldose 1-epimerase n=1 Tax=Rhodanobacter sp. DHB23 TaxID=2775923 RepID=UPI001782B8FE|nr:aldose epimerase [Rhodanobacter sp. DHB23]MBD8871328.1 aldose epimerase [Rhodanobacter sp. DHB23]
MATEQPADAAQQPLPPGELIHIGNEALALGIAPHAGGRIAQISCDGVAWLSSFDRTHAAIAWGSYPMLPWAGRIRHGRFRTGGTVHQLPVNLGAHAIHGVGFAMSWDVTAHAPACVELSLALPADERWPFGGVARQRIRVEGRVLRLELGVTAGSGPMPRPVVGWHPWFLKPDAMDFHPEAAYPRDGEGMAIHPTQAPPPGPWDDCFINTRPVLLHRAGQTLRLRSDCDHWVVYDEPSHATCVEPQTGPPDAFNLAPAVLAPGATVSAWFELEWLSDARPADP